MNALPLACFRLACCIYEGGCCCCLQSSDRCIVGAVTAYGCVLVLLVVTQCQWLS
jgi:hypothetical protein